MQLIILMIHVLVAFTLIALVLLQQGKGAEVGAAFGSGASQTMFGSQGSTSFLVKLTASLAAIFFITSISLTYIASSQYKVDPLLNISAPAKEASVSNNQTKGAAEQKKQMDSSEESG